MRLLLHYTHRSDSSASSSPPICRYHGEAVRVHTLSVELGRCVNDPGRTLNIKG